MTITSMLVIFVLINSLSCIVFSRITDSVLQGNAKDKAATLVPVACAFFAVFWLAGIICMGELLT